MTALRSRWPPDRHETRTSTCFTSRHPPHDRAYALSAPSHDRTMRPVRCEMPAPRRRARHASTSLYRRGSLRTPATNSPSCGCAHPRPCECARIRSRERCRMLSPLRAPVRPRCLAIEKARPASSICLLGDPSGMHHRASCVPKFRIRRQARVQRVVSASSAPARVRPARKWRPFRDPHPFGDQSACPSLGAGSRHAAHDRASRVTVYACCPLSPARP